MKNREIHEDVIRVISLEPALEALAIQALTKNDYDLSAPGASTTNSAFLEKAQQLAQEDMLSVKDLEAAERIYGVMLVTLFASEEGLKQRGLSLLRQLHALLIGLRSPLSVDLEIFIKMFYSAP